MTPIQRALPLAVGVASAACGARSELPVPTIPCSQAPLEPEAVEPVTLAGSSHAPGVALSVTDEAVFFAVGVEIGTARSSVARAPLSNGVLASTPAEGVAADATYFDGPIVHDEKYLYFPNFGVEGPGGLPNSMQIVRQSVVAAPLDGGPSVMLDNPPQIEPFVINDVAVSDEGSVLWLLWNDVPGGSTVLARWDGATTTTVAPFPEPASGLATSGGLAFVLTATALYAVPIAGGAPTMLRSLPGASSAQILAVAGGALFYSPDGSSIVRRQIASGVEATVVSGVALPIETGAGHHGWADETWLYFVTGPPGQPRTISRANVASGVSEIVWDAPDRPPSGAVASDACNVYWLTASTPWDVSNAGGPSILMYRRK